MTERAVWMRVVGQAWRTRWRGRRDGNPPAFEPVKRVGGGTRNEPKHEDEKWNRGRRGGSVHVARDADAAKILEVCKTTDADLTLAKARAIEKAGVSDGETLRLSSISRETAEEVKRVCGVAPTSLIPTVGGDEIRHTINRHGKHVDGLTKGETQKNQIPITADDIAKIGEVLESYDSIEKGSPNVRHGVATETVKFKKKCDDGTVYTVFAVPENLQFRTMWKTHTQERQHAGEMCEPLPLRPRLGRVDIADCTTPSV